METPRRATWGPRLRLAPGSVVLAPVSPGIAGNRKYRAHRYYTEVELEEREEEHGGDRR